MRHYQAMPDLKKAELIEGIVSMSSPVAPGHSRPDSLIQTWLGWYSIRTPGSEAHCNATVRLGPKSVSQPDSLLRVLPELGGRTTLDSDGYFSGPPELIVEVAASSAAMDLRGKMRAYRSAGVREYLVWRPLDRQFDWFVLDQNEYRSNAPASPGVLQSPYFPGLALAVEALLSEDWVKVLDVLQSSVQSPEHAAFVAQLAAKARK